MTLFRSVLAAVAAAWLLAGAPASAARLGAPVFVDGWEVYRDGHVAEDILCRGRPVLLTGSHTSLRLSGECRQIRVAGAHNDVVVRLVSGGSIEITGAHNDVTWRAPRGERPVLVNSGYRNTFHAPRS